jgi:hypothetical protein
MQHFYDWRRRQTDEKKVGTFAPLLRDFMADCIPRFLAYSSFNEVRCNLAAFFYFLRRKRIKSLESVTPRVISILANSARQARSFHEYYEGYGAGDARARLIVSNVTLKEFQNGTPPCNAQFQDLVGFENAGTSPNRRGVKFNGEIFSEGILEAIIELGRQQLAVTLRENGGLQLGKASPPTTEPESAPGVETGPRLVN